MLVRHLGSNRPPVGSKRPAGIWPVKGRWMTAETPRATRIRDQIGAAPLERACAVRARRQPYNLPSASQRDQYGGSMLRVSDGRIVDATGAPIQLRGTCVGGWMNMEDF